MAVCDEYLHLSHPVLPAKGKCPTAAQAAGNAPIKTDYLHAKTSILSNHIARNSGLQKIEKCCFTHYI